MTFRVGQKVACIYDGSIIELGQSASLPWSKGAEIKCGCIYTIRQIGFSVTGHPGLRLEETINGTKDYFYNAGRFRPLVERKTDISIFTAILKTKQKDFATK